MSLSDKRLAELSQDAHALGSPVTLELLEEVERLRAELHTAQTAWDEWRASSRAGHAHATDVTSEAARLRAGVSRLHTNVAKWHNTLPRDTADSLTRDALRDLLNPTEGTDR